jgi:hypothetical protein
MAKRFGDFFCREGDFLGFLGKIGDYELEIRG